MNCNTATDVAFSFTGFAQRGGRTDHHADGWGIAFFEGHAAAVDLAWLLVYSDPWDRDATLDLALCLQHLGELESACRFYGIALVIDATDAYCLYRIGECLESLGDLEQARDAYRAAIELSRQDPAYAEVAQQAQRQLDTLT